MLETILLSMIMMVGLFLMLLSAVGFIQNKRFFTTAPKEIQEAVRPREERFPGAHTVGWFLMILSLILMIGPVIYGAWDGIQSRFTFWQFFGRFLCMLLLVKAYDILFFDLYLLCRSNFFPHFYPEVKDLVGPHLFGYNKISHIKEIATYPVMSAFLAWICTLLL